MADAIPQLDRDRFEASFLIASDYDGTQFATLIPPEGGLGVNEASELAVHNVLGARALAGYREQGGHLNRPPSEIVESLLPLSDGYMLEKICELKADGAPNDAVLEYITHASREEFTRGWIGWSDEHVQAITDVFVTAKLDPLLGQVGQKLEDDAYWPRPIEGFLEFAERAEQARLDNVPVHTAVISAGHKVFIEKTYDLYGVAAVDILVTDETVRASGRIPTKRRVKPAPLPMILAKRAWLGMYDIPPTELRDSEKSVLINQRVVYIGDDKTKDGGLATNSHVDFVLVERADPAAAWRTIERYLDTGSLTAREL